MEDEQLHYSNLDEKAREKEFNLSEKIIGKNKDLPEDVWLTELLMVKDVKEFIERRIERTKMIIQMYPHKHGEELAGQLNEDLINDAGDKLI